MDGPAPGNKPLELQMQCFSGATSAGGAKHTVTIHPDWSVTTPHDAEAERIAEAFGSYTSCVTHMERIVEAFRLSFAILTRSERVPLSVGRGGSWRVAKGHSMSGCCAGTLFGGVVAAATHTRSPMHLGRRHKVPHLQLAMFLQAAAATWGSWDGTPEVDERLHRLVREPGGIGDLWRAGIHPDDVPTLAAVGTLAAEPLPISFYLGLTYGTTDRRWLTRVLAHRPDADTASWLAWLDAPHKQSTPDSWGLWLGFGISKADVVIAAKAGLSPEHVHEVALTNGWPVSAVAAQFVKWANAGCTLKSEHFHALKRNGVYSPRPSRRAIDALCELLDRQGGISAHRSMYDRPDRTDLAVMLEILGNRHEVSLALGEGVRTLDDLGAYVRSYDRALKRARSGRA